MGYQANSTVDDRQTVSAFFETSGEAEKAKSDLLAAGFPAEDMTMSSAADHHSASAAPHHQSIIRSLLDIFVFMPPHEQPTYEEALRRGGVVIAVRADSAAYERAIDILDRDGAIDLDERETEWKAEGWTPESSVARPGGPGSAMQAGFEQANSHDPLVDASATADVRERIGTGTADMTVGTDLFPASAASEVNRGFTRDTSHGRTRIRTYRNGVQDVPAGIDPQI